MEGGAETHVFSLENGDDWVFFYDDQYPPEAYRTESKDSPPIQISTISGTETELIRLRYNNEPKHKVVHKGACSFTGIKTPVEDSSHGERISGTHSPLTVQVHIEDI